MLEILKGRGNTVATIVLNAFVDIWNNDPLIITATLRYRVISVIVSMVASALICRIICALFHQEWNMKKRVLIKIGSILLFIGSLMSLSLGQYSTLHCERSNNICAIK